MVVPQPRIGEWYRANGGEIFEVVAIDDIGAAVDVQYFDGTVGEIEREDWEAQWTDGLIEAAEPPEDWSGSVDVEADEDQSSDGERLDGDTVLRAGPLEGLDLFE
jgi:hypothetical protein